MSNTNEKLLAAALARLDKLAKTDSFDPLFPGSKPNKGQQSFLSDIKTYKHRIIRAGNRAGKGATVARELGWILNNNHPSWKRPPEWGDGPILVLVAGQSRMMIETELWEKKISQYLEIEEWRHSRVGGSLQYVENKKTGDKIIFVSHADSSDKNRKMMQGYTAQYVWLDEMPSSSALFQEIRARAATNGYFVASFTPKFRSDSIRQVVDSIQPPYGQVYRLSMLDNPVFKDRKEEVLRELDGYTQAYKDAVIFGDWYSGDTAVYEFQRDISVEEPEGYHPSWRHVESVDPAIKSKFGYTLWAERPIDGVWFLVKDEYITGIFSPDDLFSEVQKRGQGYNIIRRVCDPHESWYIGHAAKQKVNYMLPFDKANRKGELIKNLQLAISRGKIKIAPWCGNFLEEVSSCQWAESGDKIVNSSSYHTLDCAQYFIDCVPKYEGPIIPTNPDAELRLLNQKRKEKEHQQRLLNQGKNNRARMLGGWPVRKHGGFQIK